MQKGEKRDLGKRRGLGFAKLGHGGELVASSHPKSFGLVVQKVALRDVACVRSCVRV